MTMKFRLTAVFAAVLSVFLAGRPALALSEAGESYIPPTYAELVQTVVLLGGLDIQKQKVLDEYIRLMYCELYKTNYKDDFAWAAIEKQVLNRITSRREYSRTLYQLVGEVKLDKYDMTRQLFPFVPGTGFQNVGSVSLTAGLKSRAYCDVLSRNNMANAVFPDSIDLALPQPFTFTYYKIAPSDAQKLLDRMQKLKIADRKLYVRLRFHVQSVVDDVQHHYKGGSLHLGGEITDLDLFYDENMTMLAGDVSLKQ